MDRNYKGGIMHRTEVELGDLLYNTKLLSAQGVAGAVLSINHWGFFNESNKHSLSFFGGYV